MVKNKGFLPSEPSEIPIQRNQMREIIFFLLRACKHPDPETQIPFDAEAIIANPPAHGRNRGFQETYNEEHPDSKGIKELAKDVGAKWKAMTDEEKKPYLEAAF